MSYTLVDSHCHLDFPTIYSDLNNILERATDVGVGMLINISVKMNTFENVQKIAEQFPHIYCSIGIHPNEVYESIKSDQLIKLAARPKVIAIGETGLDYHHDKTLCTIQRKSFREHIAASKSTGLPLIVHTRNADKETMDILEEEYAKEMFCGVIHCFSGSHELAKRALKIGFYISCSGIITFPSAQELCTIISKVPLNKLLIETDAPYLAPKPNRGKINEPSYIIDTARKLSEIKDVSLKQISQSTTDNFFKLFTKADRNKLLYQEN